MKKFHNISIEFARKVPQRPQAYQIKPLRADSVRTCCLFSNQRIRCQVTDVLNPRRSLSSKVLHKSSLKEEEWCVILEWTLAKNTKWKVSTNSGMDLGRKPASPRMQYNGQLQVNSIILSMGGWSKRNLHRRMKIQVTKYCSYFYIKSIGLGFF